jgi:uncharacterized protein YbjT (DUF2867 family)
MTARVLVIGASGRVGSFVLAALGKDDRSVVVRPASSRPEQAARWRAEGRDAVLLDLDRPETFAGALRGVDRVFLLTGYSAAMLDQARNLVDAAVDAGVDHIVHLGVFGAGEHRIPHFTWHAQIETYIEASGIAWTHLHPNVISDSILVTQPPIGQTGSFTVFWGEVQQGWVFAADIGAVAAAVLRDGPVKHGGAHYWLSTEVLSGPEVAEILSRASGIRIQCHALQPDALAAHVRMIPTSPERAYMESAVEYMRLAAAGELRAQTAVRDDVLTVLGRPGTTMAQWARENLQRNPPDRS